MRIAIVGSGAVGGYYGALLSRAGHDVTFFARGAHLDAIRRHGLTVRGPYGEWVVNATADHDAVRTGHVDLVILAVKTYDNETALPMLGRLVGPGSLVLTLQNGVDSPHEVAACIGTPPVLGGAAYVATAITAPGVIEQTGRHRRIVFGEVFGDRTEVTERARALAATLSAAGIEAEAHADGRVALWEKLIYLAPFAAFTGAARLPIGPLWAEAETRPVFFEACREVERVARAEGVAVSADCVGRIVVYMEKLPPATRSSLLIDLTQGKRIEVEALHGAVVRRAARLGIPVPVMGALYAVLRPWGQGRAG